MRWADKFRLRLRSLFRRRRIDHELDDELRLHLEEQIQENVAAGLTPEEARYAARCSIGGVAQIKEECRDMRRVLCRTTCRRFFGQRGCVQPIRSWSSLEWYS